jgi:glycosyltransferase involved in cell wall biosynthesis
VTAASPRVLRVITRLNIGGPARQALLLTRALADEFPTRLVTGRPAPGEGELTDPLVPLDYVPLVRQPAPVTDARAFVELRARTRGDRPAIIHTHMAKAGTVGRLAALSGRRRPRLVHTFHGHVLDGYFRPTMAAAFLRTERILARRTDVLIAVSEEVRDELLELDVGREEQFRVIRLGFELGPHLATVRRSGQLRTVLGLGDDEPLIGIVGRLVPIKDVHLAIEAIARLPEVHLAVLGDGEVRSTLEHEVDARGLTDRVHFTGWWHDIPAAMSDLDVVILTSRNEGTPVALIEASACGRPIVSTQVGGVATVVRDGQTGYLVPTGDAGALADRISALLGDPTRAQELGEAGREWVRDRFSADRLIRDIRGLYRELTSDTP